MEAEVKSVIVVPTIRENNIKQFLTEWKNEFANHRIIIVEDNPTKTFDVGTANVEHYSWEEIDKELGKQSWIIPRRTDCIRSYGFLKAYRMKPDFIVTLDDDCFPNSPQPYFLDEHWSKLVEPEPSSAWVNTLENVFPRGYPYFTSRRKKFCVLNHGLWNKVPDFDAPSQLYYSRQPTDIAWVDKTIPCGSYFPMCGMNIAFRPEVTPALYFLLMGKDYEFDRFGDIWSGIIIKKIVDHLGYCISSGKPSITHLRASNVWTNLKKERTGLEVNEFFWSTVDNVRLKGETFSACYKEIANNLTLPGDYWKKLTEAMLAWTELFAA